MIGINYFSLLTIIYIYSEVFTIILHVMKCMVPKQLIDCRMVMTCSAGSLSPARVRVRSRPSVMHALAASLASNYYAETPSLGGRPAPSPSQRHSLPKVPAQITPRVIKSLFRRPSSLRRPRPRGCEPVVEAWCPVGVARGGPAETRVVYHSAVCQVERVE